MQQEPTQHGRVSRRGALKVLGGAGIVGVGAAGIATASSAWADESAADHAIPTASCVLVPEVDEGPFYLDLEKIRRNIAEDRTGVPVELRFTVINTQTCRPIPSAAVDIWHCDASGTYSGYASPDPNDPGPGGGTGGPPPPDAFKHREPINDLTFLRGVQLTDHRGVAQIRSIYPGWYQGRAVHIHLKVHVSGTVNGSKYTGGHISHTGQMYMPESMNLQIEKLDPYAKNPIVRVTNDKDGLYTNFGGASTEFTVTPLRRGQGPSTQHGLLATIAVGVNPDAVPGPQA
jgi:protocatechuate 3,4-dioxygenase beta subunit